MPTLRHRLCLHEWELPEEFAARIDNDPNGGVGPAAPPLHCPGCKLSRRYSEFEVVKPNA